VVQEIITVLELFCKKAKQTKNPKPANNSNNHKTIALFLTISHNQIPTVSTSPAH
jgi:hypothetical protein